MGAFCKFDKAIQDRNDGFYSMSIIYVSFLLFGFVREGRKLKFNCAELWVNFQTKSNKRGKYNPEVNPARSLIIMETLQWLIQGHGEWVMSWTAHWKKAHALVKIVQLAQNKTVISWFVKELFNSDIISTTWRKWKHADQINCVKSICVNGCRLLGQTRSIKF